MADLSDTIETAAAQPASATADGVTVSAKPLPDLIAADRYLKGNGGAAKKTRGIRFTKFLPPAPTGRESNS